MTLFCHACGGTFEEGTHLKCAVADFYNQPDPMPALTPTHVEIAAALAILEAGVNEMEEDADDTDACQVGLCELEQALLFGAPQDDAAFQGELDQLLQLTAGFRLLPPEKRCALLAWLDDAAQPDAQEG